VIIILYSWSY